MIKVKSDCRGMSSDEIIETILSDRGVDYDFLNPTVDDLLPLDSLQNVDMAYKIISEAVDSGKKILILADVDVDGVCSCAIIYRYLKHFTDNVICDINEGKKHGIEDYNLSKLENVDLLIIVDSINKAVDYQPLIEMGIQIVIFDHHIIPKGVKDLNLIIVSSADEYENKDLSGSGVCWKFVKYYDEQTLYDYSDGLVDLAACGIVADMCSLKSRENRYICNLGFKNQNSIAIKKINGSYEFNSQAISFGIASLVNSAMRTHHNREALDLFISDNETEIKSIIKRMKLFKEEQNSEVARLVPICESQYEIQKDNRTLIFIIESDYDVSGLIGNKLLEKYKKPLFVVRYKNNVYAGSARGIGVDDFKYYVDKTELAVTGGHENAFGIQFQNKEKIIKKLNDELSNIEFNDNITADIQIDKSQINIDLINKVKCLNRISGTGYPPINVLITDVEDYTVSTMSNGKHLKIDCDDFVAIKWNYIGDIDEFDNCIIPKSLTFIGSLDSNFFGRKLTNQLIINNYEVYDIG